MDKKISIIFFKIMFFSGILYQNTQLLKGSKIDQLIDSINLALKKSVKDFEQISDSSISCDQFFKTQQPFLEPLKEILENSCFSGSTFTKCLNFQIELFAKCKKRGGLLFRWYNETNLITCKALAKKLCFFPSTTDQEEKNRKYIEIAQLISKLFWNFHSIDLLDQLSIILNNKIIDLTVLSFVLSFSLSKFKNKSCTKEQIEFAKTIDLQELLSRISQCFLEEIELISID